MVDGSREVRAVPQTLPTGSDCPQAVIMAKAIHKSAYYIRTMRIAHRPKHAPGCWYPQVSADPQVSLGQMQFSPDFFARAKMNGAILANPGNSWYTLLLTDTYFVL